MLNYKDTIKYLFDSAPLFQNVGAGAYKEGLSNTHLLDKHFNHPHRQFMTIHVAGTNGKGSVSHTLAAILQAAGYHVGLYTSPHLVDFRERIRVDGKPVDEQYVIDFVEKHRSFFEPLHPSFFELATAMAFNYFAEKHVDIAVVEVGLGGRLDCTNVISPILSIITNISLDHTQFLGNTLAAIAGEKAGIIKKGIPVIIGETVAETRPVFEAKAKEMEAPIYFAEEDNNVISSYPRESHRCYVTKDYAELDGELGGLCQEKNTNTILCALHHLPSLHISEQDVRNGFRNVCETTGLMGRWQIISQHPLVICDTGHNVGGWQYLSKQLESISDKMYKSGHKLSVIIGMVNDKDINGVMSMMPKQADYYFTKASVKRARNEEEVKSIAENHGLKGRAYPDVITSYHAALKASSVDDTIFVGGSSFIVADLLSNIF
jgi:dihydrofolate synthase/folylpolyglutamate synthase